MSLLVPGLLLVGLLAAPILLLYMLKLRRRETPVSSTYLWQQILRDRQANTPWQWLRRNLLLFLQLLILAALVLALARPAVPVPSLTSGATVILLDGSASMNATDVAPTRFAAARAQVQKLIDGLPRQAPVALILAANEPRLLASGETDRAVLRAALAAAQPVTGSVDWPAAFALAAGASGAAPDSTTVIVSDGGLPQSGLPNLPGDVKYLPVGSSTENLAITALSVRPSGQASQGSQGSQLFASVRNYGSQAHSAILSIYAGTGLVDARQVDLVPGKSQDVVLDGLPAAGQRYSARLTPVSGAPAQLDAFPLDDAATTIYRPAPGGLTLLVSPGNLFLRQLLGSLPGVQPFSLLAGPNTHVEIPKDRYDVYILDGVIPKELPPGNLLILNPPQNPFFPVTGTFTDMSGLRLAKSPLTRFVKWDSVHILQARAVSLPDWAEALVQVKAGPLVFIGETQGRRLAVVTFDLHDSDLPLQISYPILFSSLIQYLVRPANLTAADAGSDPAAATNLQIQPGGGILIHPAGVVQTAQVTLPDGNQQSVRLDQGQAVFNATGETGVYSVAYPGRPDLGEDDFSVSLFSPEESDIRPRASLQIGQRRLTPQVENDVGQRELWPWLAALALLILLVEWWVYHQRQIAPGTPWRGRAFWTRLRARFPSRRQARG